MRRSSFGVMGRWSLVGIVCVAALLVAFLLRGLSGGSAAPQSVVRMADESAPTEVAADPATLASAPNAVPTERREAVALDAERSTASASGGITVDGRVLDPDGRPVDGASIVAHAFMMVRAEPRVLARTGADGRFSLRGVPIDTAIGARKAGWAPTVQVSAGVVAAREVSYELRFTRPGGTLRGLVVDPTGAPVASALVEIEELGSRDPSGLAPLGADLPSLPLGCSARRRPAPVWLRTDEDGSFEVTGALPGDVRLRASAKDLVRTEIRQAVRVGEVTTVRVELVHGATLVGRAERPDGSPAQGARVALRVPGQSGRSEPVDPADGSFRFTGLAAGKAKVWLYGAGLGSARKKVVLVEGRETHWSGVAHELLSLEGQVVAETGESLVGWSVRARGAADFSRRVTTDESGRFSFEGVLRSIDRLELGPARSELFFEGYVAETVDPWSRPQPLRLVVPVNQIPSATVRFSIEQAEAEAAESLGARFERLGEGNAVSGFCSFGRDGVCVAEGLPPGRYLMRVEVDEHPALATHFDLDVGQDLDLGLLKLLPRGHVELRVTCPRTEILEYGVLCDLVDASGIFFDGVELDGPKVPLGPLPEGTYRLVSDDFLVAPLGVEFTVVAGRTEALDLELVPATYRTFLLSASPPDRTVGVLTCRLLDAAGAEIRSRSFEWNADLGDDGLPLEELGLVPGRFILEVRDDTGRTARAAFEIETVDHPTEDTPPIPLTLRAP
ncbi:MAG: carboxypeptidase-like regulatory domain-containing protein [Planctomycetota bacterium]